MLMDAKHALAKFAPPFEKRTYSQTEIYRLQPFFSNLDQSVYAPLVLSPEVVGALCSRASRAADDLRSIFLHEYVTPFLEIARESKDSDEDWQHKQAYGRHLQAFVDFLHAHPIEKIFSNPRARSFYSKWLAQYGDDSIAQMAGMHLVYSGLSQVAIKHFEDQRIGLAPIEKSTRYVNYSHKVNGQYLYYTDPTLADVGLETEYRRAMDGLFDTYLALLPKLIGWLTDTFPDEKASVVEKKAFDTLRGLLPCATVSQVAFFGNGQAFEYLIARSARHRLGEVRWAAERAYQELYKVGPSFLRRLKSVAGKGTAEDYQEYMAGRGQRVEPFINKMGPAANDAHAAESVRLLEFDPAGQDKVIAGMLYAAPNNYASWDATLGRVRHMSDADKRQVLEAYLAGRTARWQKVGRAFENAYVRFEIVMNIGAWRDLHRHRMHTQQRQYFSCHHGYDVPLEIIQAGLEDEFRSAIAPVEAVHAKLASFDRDLAQYAVTLAHRMRFMQWQNLRQAFWEMELRTIPEGHPDYRRIEQEKFRLLQKVYPLITPYMRVNMGNYDFARRGQDEKIQAKLSELEKLKV